MAAYVATLAAFLALDAGWLVLVAIEMLRTLLGPILREQPDVLAALAFYVVSTVGLYTLAVRPAVAAVSCCRLHGHHARVSK